MLLKHKRLPTEHQQPSIENNAHFPPTKRIIYYYKMPGLLTLPTAVRLLLLFDFIMLGIENHSYRFSKKGF